MPQEFLCWGDHERQAGTGWLLAGLCLQAARSQACPLTRGLEKGLSALLLPDPGSPSGWDRVSLWHEAWPFPLEPGCLLLGSAPAVPHDVRLRSHLKKHERPGSRERAGRQDSSFRHPQIYLLLFFLPQIRVAGAPAATQGWPGLGLALTREGSQGPLSTQIPTKPETVEVWGWGEDSQEQECVLLERVGHAPPG